MPIIPYPPQISTDRRVNDGAMAWAAQLVDTLGTRYKAPDADKLDGIDSTGFRQIAVAVPRARIYNTVAILTANATVTALDFSHAPAGPSVRYDTDTIHSDANPTRLTCNTAGLYEIFGNIEWASAAGGERTVEIRLNGSTVISRQDQETVGAGVISQEIGTHYLLSATDYVELVVFQSSGGNLNVNASANYSPEFGMTWLSA